MASAALKTLGAEQRAKYIHRRTGAAMKQRRFGVPAVAKRVNQGCYSTLARAGLPPDEDRAGGRRNASGDLKDALHCRGLRDHAVPETTQLQLPFE